MAKATAYTLTVNNAAAPNTNSLQSVSVAVPAQAGTPSGLTVTATNPGGAAVNWLVDSAPAGGLRVRECGSGDICYVGGSNEVGPGGSLTLQFSSSPQESLSNAPVAEVWTVTGYADSGYAHALPLAGSAPAVAIGEAPSLSSASNTTFTYGAAGTFTVAASGVPTPSLSAAGALPSGLTFTDNGDGTGTLGGTPSAAGSFPLSITAHNGYGADATQSFTLTVNVLPTLVALSPSSATAGGGGLTLTVSGTNFLSGATVEWNGSARATTVVSGTQLTALIGAADLAPAGTVSVSVLDPGPGGGASNALSFAVNNPVPAISSLAPSAATAGAGAQTLTINGTNFLSASTVTYNGVAHPASYGSATQLTITLSAGDQGTVGSDAVVVTNPAPGGGVSNGLNFTVNNPVPAISSLSPSSATVGAGRRR